MRSAVVFALLALVAAASAQQWLMESVWKNNDCSDNLFSYTAQRGDTCFRTSLSSNSYAKFSCEADWYATSCNADCSSCTFNTTLSSSTRVGGCSGVSIGGAALFSKRSCGPLIRDQGSGKVDDYWENSSVCAADGAVSTRRDYVRDGCMFSLFGGADIDMGSEAYCSGDKMKVTFCLGSACGQGGSGGSFCVSGEVPIQKTCGPSHETAGSTLSYCSVSGAGMITASVAVVVLALLALMF